MPKPGGPLQAAAGLVEGSGLAAQAGVQAAHRLPHGLLQHLGRQAAHVDALAVHHAGQTVQGRAAPASLLLAGCAAFNHTGPDSPVALTALQPMQPPPRVALGLRLAGIASAAMDISDGLLLDCWRMGWVSGVTLALDSTALPVADRARLADCVRWGDDYELLFTAPADAVLPVRAIRIGEVRARAAAPLLLDETPLDDPARLGYRHG